ncbi:hypothetical protein BAE44_0014321, partial [Dichanthelium oligosanthes]
LSTIARRDFVSSHQDRGRQKRDFHRSWITRINATTRVHNIFESYSKLIHNMYKPSGATATSSHCP